jgi:hypothetical protein
MSGVLVDIYQQFAGTCPIFRVEYMGKKMAKDIAKRRQRLG